ncbi:uncharacterized protein LOC5501165 [Nematostella vectensis]|uniref:uncharacterized protein LOC5501165 n=1 Tax=Nematostella vectensis TaxID=45351 RepID=UPI002076FD44|nr:uncharacterized protein LOC5501165 [Nematostella vectensis]
MASLETVDSGSAAFIRPSSGFTRSRLQPATSYHGFHFSRDQQLQASCNGLYNEYDTQNSGIRRQISVPERRSANFQLNVVADVDDEMQSIERRLESYIHWPENCPVRPRELAMAGFYYTGCGDQVRCFSCDLQLGKWVDGDEPFEEHLKHRPSCGFILESKSESKSLVTCKPVEASTEDHGSFTGSQDRMRPVIFQSERKSLPALPIGAVPEVSQHLQTLGNAAFLMSQGGGSVCKLSSNQAFHVQSGCGQEPVIGVGREGSRRQYLMEQSQKHQAKPSDWEATYASREGSVQGTKQESHGNLGKLEPYFGVGREGGSRQQLQGMYPVKPEIEPLDNPYLPHPQANLPARQGRHYAGDPYYQEMLRSQNRQDPAITGMPERARQSVPTETASRYEYMRSAGKERQESFEEQTRRRPHLANLKIPVVRPVKYNQEGPLVRSEDLHHVTSPTDLQSEHHRLTTFVDWPESSPVRPWELSSAGFYYLGDQDSVKCYKCGVALRNWEPDDLPWVEHEKWSPHCPLVIEYLKNRPNPGPVEVEDPYLHNPPMQGQGHSPPESEMYFPSNQRRSENPEIGRRSPPRVSKPPSLPHQPFLAPAGNFSSESLRVASQVTHGWESPYNTFPGQQKKVACPEDIWEPEDKPVKPQGICHKEESYYPSIGNRPHVMSTGNEGDITSKDIQNALAMGFSREDIDAACARKLAESGSPFSSLQELTQALLDHEDPSSQPSNCAIHGNSRAFLDNLMPSQSLRPPGNLSLPSTNEKQVLRRTNSAPESSGSSPEGESLQQKLERMQEERLCKICMDAEVGIVFLPCGHLSCCPGCAEGMELCPMCRAPIRETIRTFLS